VGGGGGGAARRRVGDEGLTDAVFLAEVYAEVLARYSEEPGLSINLTQFDRTRFAPEVDAIVGDFTSLSILSADTRCAVTFRDRAKALQRRMFSNLSHASVSGVAVERMLNKQRRAQVTMPVVFTCGLGVVEHTDDDSPYLGVIDYGLSQTPQVWMDLQVYEHHGGLMLNMDAVEAIFPSGMVDEMFRALVAASYLALAALTGIGVPLGIAKILGDSTIYMASYLIQRRVVFREKA